MKALLTPILWIGRTKELRAWTSSDPARCERFAAMRCMGYLWPTEQKNTTLCLLYPFSLNPASDADSHIAFVLCVKNCDIGRYPEKNLKLLERSYLMNILIIESTIVLWDRITFNDGN